MIAPDIDVDEIPGLHDYAQRTIDFYTAAFAVDEQRFPDGCKLIRRFDDQFRQMMANSRHLYSAVYEAHNELCVAHRLLEKGRSEFIKIEYEPSLPNTGRSIDFRALTSGGRPVHVDVKTIRPKPTDRWDQFERARSEAWCQNGSQLLLNRNLLGGELWHNKFAARSRMLEYALELEGKARELSGRTESLWMIFCGSGFEWHGDDLEDFLYFYRTGRHRPDDFFADMERRHIDQRGLTLDQSIEEFPCLFRSYYPRFPGTIRWQAGAPSVPAILETRRRGDGQNTTPES